MSSLGTGASAPSSDVQLRPRALLLSPRGPFSPRDQNRSTVPSLRGAISSVARRWRNDSRRLPSCPNPLSASADPRGISAAHTRRLAAPDRVTRHAFPVTFEHDACAPFRSGAGLTQRLCGDRRVHCSTKLHRPSRPIRFGDERLPSVSADLAGCDGLTRPPADCLATARGARVRCIRPTSASHYLSTTSTRATFVPSISSRLAPRPFAQGLHPG